MKNLVLTVCALASSVALAAANNTLISFSTPGPDTYADGTTVLDGECYALVWSAGTFGGFLANGQPANAADKVVATVSVAEGGRCPTIVYQIDADLVKSQFSGGAFSVWLMDTRRIVNGKVTVGQIGADGLAVAVNAASAAGSASVASGSIGAADGQGGATASAATALPANAPQAKIEALEIKGGKVYVTLSGTVPYLNYNLASGATPDKLEAKVAQPVSGAATTSEKVILVTDQQEGGAFFKAVRN